MLQFQIIAGQTLSETISRLVYILLILKYINLISNKVINKVHKRKMLFPIYLNWKNVILYPVFLRNSDIEALLCPHGVYMAKSSKL